MFFFILNGFFSYFRAENVKNREKKNIGFGKMEQNKLLLKIFWRNKSKVKDCSIQITVDRWIVTS